MAFEDVKALIFDVFGTVVDWETTVTSYLRDSYEAKKPGEREHRANSDRFNGTPTLSTPVDWLLFTRDWRKEYLKATKKGAKDQDETNFVSVDEIHLNALKELVVRYGIKEVWSDSELEQLSLIWHKLDGKCVVTEAVGVMLNG